MTGAHGHGAKCPHISSWGGSPFVISLSRFWTEFRRQSPLVPVCLCLLPDAF